jgi:hypothetical protein
MNLFATKLADFLVKNNFWGLKACKGKNPEQHRNRIKWKTDQELITTLQHSVSDPRHFGTDPDPTIRRYRTFD